MFAGIDIKDIIDIFDIFDIYDINVGMASLLIRHLSDETKRALRIRAAENGHTLSEEARMVLTSELQKTLNVASKHWADQLATLGQSFGGVELERPTSSGPRDPFAEHSDSDAA